MCLSAASWTPGSSGERARLRPRALDGHRGKVAAMRRNQRVTVSGVRRPQSELSTTLENEAIATVENEATQTDWMGDLCGGLGSDSAAGGGRCSAAPGRTRPRHWPVDGGAGGGLGWTAEV